MGSGTFTTTAYACYNTSLGRAYDAATCRASVQEFTTTELDESLDPRKFSIRECVNSEEHPNTIPVILALDVTGSMGNSCRECAEALGVIMANLYKKYKDIEFCIMGIGDLYCDDAPIQMSQFESDIRIAESIDKLWMEGGGGGNHYESYTAAWYMGLKRTKLDAYDKQGRKGIIITMGDEELNPYLSATDLKNKVNIKEQSDIETNVLYKQAIEKFDIFHLAVEDSDNCYRYHKDGIEKSFGQLLGDRLKHTTVNRLAQSIEECIDESMGNYAESSTPAVNSVNENGEITW